MNDYFVFELSRTIMFILGTLIFALVCIKRRDLISLIYAYIAGSISEIFRLFSQELYDIFEIIGLVFSSLTLLLIIFAIFHEYSQTFHRRSNPKGTPIILLLFAQILPLALQLTIGILLFIALYLILRIYIAKRTPTHAFLCFILICGIINFIAILLRDVGINGAQEFYIFSSVVMATILLLTGVVALLEERIVNSEKRYRSAYNRAEFYKDLFVHDINNILQNLEFSLEIMSQQLKKLDIKEDLEEWIYLAKRQLNRGASLGSNVKKLSDLEIGEIENEFLEAFQILKKAIQDVKENFVGERIKINIDSDGDTFYVLANKFLYDIFRIVLNNAIIHNKNPEKEILIRVLKEKKDGINYLRLEFIDNGNGMQDEIKEIIFYDISKKPKSFKRIGLGLLLVKKVIERFKGKIWAENRIIEDYKKGSKIIMLIPLVPV